MSNLKIILDILSLWALPAIIVFILIWGIIKKVPVYETFIEGAKDGVKVSINIIPYIVAIVVAISMFRASGAVEILSGMFGFILNKIHLAGDFIPLAIVRSLSGSAALGVFSDIAAANGPDSFITKMSAVMLGSSETTFYVLAVYFGAVGIKKFRYALLTGILADVIGIFAAIFISKLFFM